MGIEHRRHKRALLNLEAMIGNGYESYRARIVDLSDGGCYVETIAHVGANEILLLKVLLPTENWFDVKVRVLYCHPQLGFGSEFIELTPLQEEVLRNLIEYESDE